MTTMVQLLVLIISSILLHCTTSHAAFNMNQTVCSEIFPDLLIADGDRQLSSNNLCGTELVVRYTACIHSIHMCSLDVTSQSEHYCSSIVVSDDTRKGLLGNHSIEYEIIDEYTLTIISRQHPICIGKLVIKTCETSNREQSKRFTVQKRSAAPINQNLWKHDSLVKPVVAVVSSIGFLIILSTLVIVSLSCCDDSKLHSNNDPESGKTDNHSQFTKETSRTVLCDGSWAPTGSPTISASTSTVSGDPDYLRPSSLNIPALFEQEQTAKVHQYHPGTLTIDMSHNNKHKDHLYSILDVSQPSVIPSGFCQSTTTITTTDTPTIESDTTTNMLDVVGKGRLERNLSDERVYFVLDVSADGPTITSQQRSIDYKGSNPNEPRIVIQEDESFGTLPREASERIYHVLEPLSTEEQYCAVCDTKILDEPDSIYLLILPDAHTKHKATPTTETEPIYQVLEKPSAICQCCLYAEENDPIYHEVERLPDPIYEHIKMFRQDTSLSETSHLYMSLEIPDYEAYETPPISPRKRYLREIRMESSHDYASIPGSPMDTPIRRVSFEELPQLGQLPQILKKRLIDQLKKSHSQDIVSDTCTDQEEEDEHVSNHPIYVNTGPFVDDTVATLSQVQMMLDGMKKHEDCDTSHKIEQQSPSRSGIFRSLSHNYTPLIVEALQRRPESYHPINIDSALEDNDSYAPVSVIMRHGKPVRKLGKRATSLRTRLSIFRDKSRNNSKDNPTDYEIPLKLRLSPFLMINDKLPIPPPRVIKSCQLNLSRQNAMRDKLEEPNSQISTDSDHHDYSQATQIATPSKTSTNQLSKPPSLSTSEPCLNNSSDDYDYLEKLPGSPTKAVTMPRSPSPTKALLERARTAPVLRPFLLYGKNDSDDYDVLLSRD